MTPHRCSPCSPLPGQGGAHRHCHCLVRNRSSDESGSSGCTQVTVEQRALCGGCPKMIPVGVVNWEQAQILAWSRVSQHIWPGGCACVGLRGCYTPEDPGSPQLCITPGCQCPTVQPLPMGQPLSRASPFPVPCHEVLSSVNTPPSASSSLQPVCRREGQGQERTGAAAGGLAGARCGSITGTSVGQQEETRVSRTLPEVCAVMCLITSPRVLAAPQAPVADFSYSSGSRSERRERLFPPGETLHGSESWQ